jgi:hypothetical protein
MGELYIPRVHGAGRGPVWNSTVFMNKLRGRHAQLNAASHRIMQFGFTDLYRGRRANSNVFLPRATVEYNTSRVVGLKIGTVVLVIDRGLGDYLIGIPDDDLRVDRKYVHMNMRDGAPFIIGTLSPDTAPIRKVLPYNFPAYACAVTPKGGTLLFENLDSSGKSIVRVVFRLYKEHMLPKYEIEDAIVYNDRLLKQIERDGLWGRYADGTGVPGHSRPDYCEVPTNFFIHISTGGKILECNEGAKEEHFVFWLTRNLDRTVELTGYKQKGEGNPDNNMFSDTIERSMPPEYIIDILLRSLDRYNLPFLRMHIN